MPRTKRYATPRDDRRRNGLITVVAADQGVWQAALNLAGGDPRRLEPHADGSVTVHNKPIRK